MTKGEYFNLKRKIESDRLCDLAALDRIWELANRMPPPESCTESELVGAMFTGGCVGQEKDSR